MKKIILLVLVLQLTAFSALSAIQNKNTWDYPLFIFDRYEINGSQDFYQFESDLRKDNDVVDQFNNQSETGIISYLLFEDNKIVIDESDIPDFDHDGVKIERYLPSHSMGKSLVSYITGHAICEGYIESVDERLTGWDVIQNTLYEDQVLINLLNMSAGDQEYIGERLDPQVDNQWKATGKNLNMTSLETIMNSYMQNTNKGRDVYNYSALTTHVIFNYVLHKSGDDILDKVFTDHVKVKNNVYFTKTQKGIGQSARYSFYADRYDYLRIAKTIMNDWHSDTCIGDYLRTVYDRRIVKADDIKYPVSVGLYTQKYGGQFHFDIYGFKRGRKIIGIDGFAGQQILIDLDNKKIIVVNSMYRNYDWKKIVYDKLAPSNIQSSNSSQCPDGGELKKTVSEDGTYFVYKCSS